MDPRTKDAIRQIPDLVTVIKNQSKEIDNLKEHILDLKKEIRPIRDAVVRKYKSK